MPNPYYDHTTFPAPNSLGSSAAMRTELNLIEQGFDKLPTLTGNGYKVAMVNATGTAMIASSALQSLAITGSTVDSTPVGGTTPAAGAFTTLSASSGITGNLTGNVTGNVSGNAGTVTNGVYTTGSYANPSWLTSLAGSKITGDVSGNAANVTGTVAIVNGGTGATTASGARTALDVPQTTGAGASGTWGISISGNAATVTNGVVTTGSYADPSWITSLAGSKITGNISGNAAGLTATLAIASGGTGQTTAGAAINALLPSQSGNSGRYLTTDGSNPSWTALALRAQSSTPFLTTLGSAAGNGTGTGTYNVAVGVNALDAFTTGASNVAVGFDAGGGLTTGSQNVAVGHEALVSTQTHTGNVAIGYRALMVNTANSNVAIGSSTGVANTTGNNNVFVGFNAAAANTTGSYNVALGRGALGSVQTTDNHIAIGFSALSGVTSGAGNIGIGYQAAATGTGNLTTGSNNIVIGNNATTSSASVSNEITLGSSTHTTLRVPGLGISSTTTTTTLPGLTTSGVVTISAGTAAAPALTTIGDTDTGVFFPAANTWAVATGAFERFRVSSTGMLIGTTTNTNSSALVANGTISETVSSVQYLVASQYDVGTAPNQLPMNQYLGTMAFQDTADYLPVGSVGVFGAGTAAAPSITTTGDLDTGVFFPAANTWAVTTGASERMRITSGGNVGIANNSPQVRFTVDRLGNAPQPPSYTAGTTAAFIGSGATGSTSYVTLISGNAGAGAIFFGDTDADSRGRVQYDHATDSMALWTSNGEKVRINSAGRVGINETAPDYLLDVNGTFGFTPGSSVTPVDNGDVVFEATNNTTLTVKLRGSDGVVRSGTITLA